MSDGRKKLAIILFNLGGPDGLDAVRPFLRNLFRDPAIIQAPGLIREALALFISTVRAKEAKANYAKMGGGSPLLPETIRQANALADHLSPQWPDHDIRIWPAMRYWHPFTHDVAAEVKAWQPDDTVLLPLYPQFSTTTTGSSLKAWRDAGGPETHAICCYPTESAFLDAHAVLIRKTWEKAGRPENVRLLFSAHGLPKKIIDAGDPYQWQVEQTVAAVRQQLPEFPDVETCYQSRVGPLEWIGPSTDEAIRKAAADGKSILLSPIAFVSEHIETLVELDEEYAEIAEELGISSYVRVPALGGDPIFIEALANLVGEALQGGSGLRPEGSERICPADCSGCPCQSVG
ncbi:ferrochelatase [Maricaulis sp. W15]|uniref:ferrochelatase n=1 Tax=Maricaulis sp. W15 TaxID=1772333 RepID=UPI000948E0C2|nr:ferrochelatase [Maricaulis sp. W15]OLF75551.1 ferrochelatase [Maricaulis sp. W15]